MTRIVPLSRRAPRTPRVPCFPFGRRVAVGLLAVAVLAVLWRGPGRASSSPTAAPVFETAEARVRVFRRTIVATGTLRPLHTTVVGAAVSGTVVEVRVDFNDRVRRGQVLARLDPEEFEARLEQARAQAAAGEVALALARAGLERQRRLADDGFLAPAALEQARGGVASAEAALRLARAQVRVAQADLRHTIVTSPVDGVVVGRSIERGQTVAAGWQTPDLFVIAGDLSTLQVIASVRENDVPAMPPAGAVSVAVDAWPGRTFDGRIVALRLADNTAQGVVTYPLVVTVANGEGVLRPGMSAEIRVEGADRREALSVPVAALRWRPGGDADATSPAAPEPVATFAPAPAPAPAPASAFPSRAASTSASSAPDPLDLDARVWVRGEGGHPEARRVAVGAMEGDRAEVRAGELRAGEHVIVGPGGRDGADPSRARDAAP